MAEIDVSEQASKGGVTIQPGDEYKVGWAVATSLNYHWVVWSNQPIEVEVNSRSIP